MKKERLHLECSLDYAQNVQVILSTVRLSKMASREEPRPDFFLSGISIIKLMPKSYFCFFSHFFSAIVFFQIIIPPSVYQRQISAPFFFSFSLLGNQCIVTLCYGGTCGPFGITYLSLLNQKNCWKNFQIWLFHGSPQFSETKLLYIFFYSCSCFHIIFYQSGGLI